MIKHAEVVNNISDYIVNILGYPVDLEEDSNLRRDIGLDSLDAVDLVAFIEDTYDVHVTEEEYSTLMGMSVGEIAEFVLNKYES